jgi:hypothetical protein
MEVTIVTNVKPFTIDLFAALPSPVFPDKSASKKRKSRKPLDRVRLSFLKGKEPYMAVRLADYANGLPADKNPMGLGSEFDRKHGRDFGPNMNFAVKFDPIRYGLILKATPEPLPGELNFPILRYQNKGRGYFYTHILCGPDQPWQFYSTDPEVQRQIPHEFTRVLEHNYIFIPLKGLVRVQGNELSDASGDRATDNTGISQR